MDTDNIKNFRVICHIDLDAFYAQVEQNLNPRLKDSSVAVIQVRHVWNVQLMFICGLLALVVYSFAATRAWHRSPEWFVPGLRGTRRAGCASFMAQDRPVQSFGTVLYYVLGVRACLWARRAYRSGFGVHCACS